MNLLLRIFSDCKEDCVSIMLGSLFHRTVIAAGIQSATDRVESRVRRVASSFLFLFFAASFVSNISRATLDTMDSAGGELDDALVPRSAALPVRRRSFKEISIICKKYRLPWDVQWSLNNAEEDVKEKGRKEILSFTREKLI